MKNLLDFYAQIGYISRASFVELPSFARLREHYLNDEQYRSLQQSLIENPHGGVLVQGTGGLHKLRFPDLRRGKGSRGGLRVIYYFFDSDSQFWLFTVYDKDEAADLSANERRILADRLKWEIAARSAFHDHQT